MHAVDATETANQEDDAKYTGGGGGGGGGAGGVRCLHRPCCQWYHGSCQRCCHSAEESRAIEAESMTQKRKFGSMQCRYFYFSF